MFFASFGTKRMPDSATLRWERSEPWGSGRAQIHLPQGIKKHLPRHESSTGNQPCTLSSLFFHHFSLHEDGQQGKFGGIKTKPAHPVHRHSMCADRSEKSEEANTLNRDGPPKGEKMVVVVVDKSHLCCGKLPIALGFQKGFFGGVVCFSLPAAP